MAGWSFVWRCGSHSFCCHCARQHSPARAGGRASARGRWFSSDRAWNGGPIDNPTPPPDVVDPPPISDSADNSMFPEQRRTPAPVQQQIAKRALPITKSRTTTIGSLRLSSAKVMALSAPRPDYPYEARRQRITGSGFVVITVDSFNGIVTDVAMEQSTGSSVLDNASVTAFRRWRFKPGTVSRVKSPITFTMTGAQY